VDNIPKSWKNIGIPNRLCSVIYASLERAHLAESNDIKILIETRFWVEIQTREDRKPMLGSLAHS